MYVYTHIYTCIYTYTYIYIYIYIHIHIYNPRYPSITLYIHGFIVVLIRLSFWVRGSFEGTPQGMRLANQRVEMGGGGGVNIGFRV